MLIDRRQFIVSGGAGLYLAAQGRTSFAQEVAKSQRSPLIEHQAVPHNAEPPLDKLAAAWITPNDLFYVRSHAPVPELKESSFELVVEGMVRRPQRLRLGQLRERFPKQSVIATMTCAGNRRNEHSLTKKVSGVPWQAGAIGNAKWDGIRLSDVLKLAEVRSGAKHVWFEGLDQIQRSSGVIPFGGSIPLGKAMSDTAAMPGALLAFRMNGKSLPPDHGFPLRTVVPGYIGARSVKWIGKIVVSDRPSPNHYITGAYRLVDESTSEKWAAAKPLYEWPVNGVICQPAAGATLKAGQQTVRGYALSGGAAGNGIERVEVSGDGGRSWSRARLAGPAQPYCWQLWEARLNLTPGKHQLVARTRDRAGNVQPERTPWNLKGYFYNAWHRVPVQVA